VNSLFRETKILLEGCEVGLTTVNFMGSFSTFTLLATVEDFHVIGNGSDRPQNSLQFVCRCKCAFATNCPVVIEEFQFADLHIDDWTHGKYFRSRSSEVIYKVRTIGKVPETICFDKLTLKLAEEAGLHEEGGTFIDPLQFCYPEDVI